jgi:hypothetical protein
LPTIVTAAQAGADVAAVALLTLGLALGSAALAIS